MNNLILPCPLDALFSPESDATWAIRSTRFDVFHFDLSMFGIARLFCPAEISRSARKRQAEYFYGRLCARAALAAIGIIGHTVQTGPQRQPVWPNGIIGSISHNNEFAVAVASMHGTHAIIGIDIESVATGPALTALIATVVSTAELAYLRSLWPALTIEAAVTMVFSAKESFFKASFPEVGRYFDFDAVRVTLVNPVQQVLELVLLETLSPRLQVGREFSVMFRVFDERTVLTMIRASL